MRNIFSTFQKALPGLRWVLASLGTLAGVFFLIYYIAATKASSLYAWFSSLDRQILSGLLSQRGPVRSDFFLFFTYLGNVEVIAAVSIVVIILLILSRRQRELLFFLAALLSSQAASVFFKMSLQRNRPDLSSALVSQSGYAFPSGHALGAVVIYGLIGYYLYKHAQHPILKRVIELSTFVLITLIGLSRLYLGVHWLSDVLAGWAMGSALFVFFVAAFEHALVSHPRPNPTPLLPHSRMHTITLFLIAFLLVFLILYFFAHPLK